MDKKDPISGKLKYNFEDLMKRMLRGENLIEHPLGALDGCALKSSGKGTKVSPAVQMKLSMVEMEMTRLAQEVETMERCRDRLMLLKEGLVKTTRVWNSQSLCNDIMLFAYFMALF